MSTNLLCCLKEPYARQKELDKLAEFDPFRSFAIFALDQIWMKGSEITYHFFDESSDYGYLESDTDQKNKVSWVGVEAEKELVRKAFNVWNSVGIDLDFVEVTDRKQAKIRIGFMKGDGSWSAVGTDCLLYKHADTRTMNFGWRISGDPDLALHEIGHALGMHHAHQNKNAGIEWNEEAVIKEFSGKPNYWSEEDIRNNILAPLAPAKYSASNWDKDSCMQYHLNAGLIKEPTEYMTKALLPKGGLSDLDKEWLKKIYGPEEQAQNASAIEVLKSEKLQMNNGDQKNFPIEVNETREYSIQLSGKSDAVMVLFEETSSGWQQIAASNDSGTDANALIQQTLHADKRYNLRIQLYWEGSAGETIVTLW
ncbi:M12 family metallopeptidase [Leucothrix arctica]|uniref:Peptidase metallopeptidase domain-containing protein n=1 Tax=Leucothrix arctica TaxID=1481894 RepID=A0A317C8C6_9GAMM|nr:M12 family metallopeptidase [Leucothrix arctica]PWQ94728.1 hypothetical protein DKT75_15695 [Leucothrix arctica]